MEVTLEMYLILCPLVFLAALVDSIGGGGGLISLPAYLLTGLPPVMASGSNKFSACFGSLTATFKYLRQGKLLMKPALLAVAGALPGSFLGAELLRHTPEAFVRTFMLIAIPCVALVLMFKRVPENGTLKKMTRGRLAACLLIGLGCGIYDGFFGPGTGTFLIILFTWCVGMDMVTASGTAKLVNLASNIGALVALVGSGNVLYRLALPAMVLSMAGGYLGAFLALKKGAQLVRYVMLGVMALLVVKLALEFFG